MGSGAGQGDHRSRAAHRRRPIGTALQHLQHRRVRRRRRGGRLRRRRRDLRARVRQRHHPPGLYRAARLRRPLRRGRQHPAVGVQPGPLCHPRPHRGAARCLPLADQDHSGRDRRRLRRQDHGVPGAGGDPPGRKIGPPREDGDDARRGVHLQRPRPRQPHPPQDGRHQGRSHHRGGRRPVVRVGQLPRTADGTGDDVSHRPLRDRELPHQGLQRAGQQALHAPLPRTAGAQRRARHRDDHRPDLRRDQHGPDRVPPQERRQEGHQGRLRPGLPRDRHDRNAKRRQGRIPTTPRRSVPTRAAASPAGSG